MAGYATINNVQGNCGCDVPQTQKELRHRQGRSDVLTQPNPRVGTLHGGRVEHGNRTPDLHRSVSNGAVFKSTQKQQGDDHHPDDQSVVFAGES